MSRSPRRAVQWIVNGYLLSLSALFAFGGRLADIAGHRRMVVIGVVVFAASSALCGATPTGDIAERLALRGRVRDGPGSREPRSEGRRRLRLGSARLRARLAHGLLHHGRGDGLAFVVGLLGLPAGKIADKATAAEPAASGPEGAAAPAA
jgi:hypothetical protein